MHDDRRMSLPAITLLASLTIACSVEPVVNDGPDDLGGKADTADPLPFLSIGHRGAPWTHAENTLPSFAAALREGANALEIDFCVTADGHVVVWHDRDPDDPVSLIRQSGAEGLPYVPWVPNIGNAFRRPVEKLTLAELRAHYDYAPNEGLIGSTFGSGDRINAHLATLPELVEWSRTTEAKGLRAMYIDVKLGDGQVELARHFAAQLAKHTADASYQILIGTPHESIISAIRAWYREHAPNKANARFMWDHEKAGVLAATRAGGYDAISMGKIVTRGWDSFTTEVESVVAGADADNIEPVLVWTIDDDAQIDELLSLGVDGILSNRPADVVRQMTRGWDDHDRTIAAIRDCFVDHEDSGVDTTCATSLSLGAPLREAQLVDRACAAGDRVAQDVFGCGGLFDAQNVRFDTDVANTGRIWWNGDDEIVVVGK
jgi:glycerophosphoryl diester phosphodiesterase